MRIQVKVGPKDELYDDFVMSTMAQKRRILSAWRHFRDPLGVAFGRVG
jgi:hypothetical protein